MGLVLFLMVVIRVVFTFECLTELGGDVTFESNSDMAS